MMERTLHREFYTSEEIFSREREHIFFREWFCIGRNEELPSPGSPGLLDDLLSHHLAVSKVAGLTLLLLGLGTLVYIRGKRRML
jgi:hypothetical protein